MAAATKHWTDGLWSRQIREQARPVTASTGTWGNWVRIKRRRSSAEGKAVCFVDITGGKKFIVVLWDGSPTPELIPAAALLHYGYWHKRKGWYPFEETT